MSTLHWLKRHSSLLEAIPSAELRAAEKDVLLYIARQSVGYRREDTRHYVSEAVLARKTGRAPSTVSAALSRLKQLKVIRCVKKGRATRHPNSWSIQNPVKWKCAWRGDTPPAGEWSTTPVERGSTTPPQRVHRHSKNLNKNQTPPPPRGAAEYWQQHGAPRLIHHSVPVRTWPELFAVEPAPPFDRRDPGLHKVPIHVHPPSFEELKRVWRHLSRGRIVWRTG